jgi:atypical dual specificity phosphatase
LHCDEILPNLFVGCCPDPEMIESFREWGITAVLNLQSDDDFEAHGIDWPELRATYSSLEIKVRRVPITDFDDHDLREKLHEAVRVLTELIRQEQTVFIHCNAGINRSPSVVICFLHWTEGWDLDEAVRHVRRCHPCAPVMDVIRRATGDRKRGMG